MATTPGYIFGGNTGIASPEELANRRRWAQAMIRSGTERTADNPWEGIANIARALSGNYADYKAGQEEEKGRAGATGQFRDLVSFMSNNGIPATSTDAPSGARFDATKTAFLDTLAGPESGGDYNKLYGGGKFSGYADHPRQNIPIMSGPNKGKTSSGAGKYMFLGSTWDEQKNKLKLPDFSPESQDAAAWDLASSTYHKATGGNLGNDLVNADGDLIKKIAGLVSGKWTSMPGGIEQAVTGDDFLSSYNESLANQQRAQPVGFNSSPNIGVTNDAQTPAQQPRNPDGGGIPGVDARVLDALANPWMSDAQRGVLQVYFQRQLEASDPVRQQQLEKGRLEIDALKNPRSEYGFVTLPDGTVVKTDKTRGTAEPVMKGEQKPTTDMQNYDAYAADERAAGRQPLSRFEYERALKNAGATNINNNMGGEKFGEEFAKGDAKALSDVSQAGLSAQRNISRINRLDGLLANAPQGMTGAWKQWAGEYGVNTEGLDNIQSAQALINALVPEQRPPGSGPMSDRDVELFKQGLPRMINQPGGNRLIMNTIRAIAQYDAEGATIVQQLRRGEIDRATAFDMLQNRVNPLDQLKDLPTVNDIDEELKRRGVQ